jgi:hypothetical protein
MKIGKLESIELREIWEHEQYDFTPWLALSENLELLGDEIGLTLIEPKIEHGIGSFSCDIVCKDEPTNQIVIIENQYGKTDHDHLGKLITYASGTRATVIIWIVENAREEHKSAIEWLNNQTGSEIGFFLIEVKAFRIGNSDVAPQFQIVEQPNEWSKEVKKSVDGGELNRSQSLRLVFWENFNSIIGQQKNTGLKTRKAKTDHWYNFSIGSSLCDISVDLVDKDGFVRVNVWIHDNKPLYEFIFSRKVEIESKLTGIELVWDRKDNKKAAAIYTTIDGLNLDDDSNYDDLAHKIIKKVVAFKAAFLPIVKEYKS